MEAEGTREDGGQSRRKEQPFSAILGLSMLGDRDRRNALIDLVPRPFPTVPSQFPEGTHDKKSGNGFPHGRYTICCLASNRGWNKGVSHSWGPKSFEIELSLECPAAQRLYHYPQLLHTVQSAQQATGGRPVVAFKGLS